MPPLKTITLRERIDFYVRNGKSDRILSHYVDLLRHRGDPRLSRIQASAQMDLDHAHRRIGSGGSHRPALRGSGTFRIFALYPRRFIHQTLLYYA